MRPKNPFGTYRIGHLAELCAALYLTAKFYRVVKRRYKSPVGEIDLIAVKGKTIIAIEVKFRRTRTLLGQTTEHAFETIHMKNRRRIIRAMEHFMCHTPRYNTYDIRFDAIAIGWPFKILHLDNAWQSGT